MERGKLKVRLVCTSIFGLLNFIEQREKVLQRVNALTSALTNFRQIEIGKRELWRPQDNEIN